MYTKEIETYHSFRKRLFDLILSSFAIIIALPFWILLPLLIKLDSKGPIFFKQRRMGRGNRVFVCYKFRTMHKNAEKMLQEHLKDPVIKEEWDKFHKLKKDPRVTKLGQFLRKYSLDELPQLFNVLKGEMSIVGPRPLNSYEIQKMPNKHSQLLLRVKPGLTCTWVIHGRSIINYDYRNQLDLEYANKPSFFKDLVLVIKTIPAVLFSRGAH